MNLDSKFCETIKFGQNSSCQEGCKNLIEYRTRQIQSPISKYRCADCWKTYDYIPVGAKLVGAQG